MLPKCVHTFSSHLLIFIRGCLKNFVGFALSLLHSQGCCFLQTEIRVSLPLVPTPFSLALLVSILISRGWRTMQPATFHPSVFHSFIPFRLLSFRKLFLSARRCSFHTISRRILSFLSYFANWAAQNPLYNILLVSSKP